MPGQHVHAAAKKAGKKAAAKKTPHSAERDARRAFEHLGRFRLLLSLLKGHHEQVDALLGLANQTFQKRMYKHAAELLRAGEHYAFAVLLGHDTEEVSSTLLQEIEHELKHLNQKASEHSDPEEMQEPIRGLFEAATERSRECFAHGAYRSALDYARAAEALSHVDDIGSFALPEHATKRLANHP